MLTHSLQAAQLQHVLDELHVASKGDDVADQDHGVGRGGGNDAAVSALDVYHEDAGQVAQAGLLQRPGSRGGRVG